MNPTKVPDWGDPESRIVLIGEAPGNKEVEQGQPFVGPSGYKLKLWWEKVGLDRSLFYITNVYPFRPFKGKIENVPKPELELYSELLLDRIDQLPDPWIIIPTGRTALKAFTGKESITDWRGSILEYNGIKVIPTLHPAEVMRTPSWEARCISDWAKIAQQCQFKDIRLPKRNHEINPTIERCQEYLDRLILDAPLAIDIETHPEQGITCVGFAQLPSQSFTIPFGVKRTLPIKRRKTKEEKDNEILRQNIRISQAVFHKQQPLEESATKKSETKAIEKWKEQRKPLKTICRVVEEWETAQEMEVAPWLEERQQFVTVGYWRDDRENYKAWKIIQALVESECPKIFHGGMYDVFWLEQAWGLKVRNYAWDTLSMHHCIDPIEEHSLAFLASVYTWEPYWKKESRGTTQSERFTYNGKDDCTTYELFLTFLEILKQRNKLEFYINHYRRMQAPLITMSKIGIKVDLEKRNQRKKDFEIELGQEQEAVEKLAGKSLVGKVNLSNKKVQSYIYDDLKLPKQMRKRTQGEKTVTADEVAIRTLMLKFPEKFGEVGQHILRCQRLGKILGSLKDTKLDPDGRFRSQYKFNTTTGRLASGKNPFGTGDNAQNVDRELRDIFVGG